jgi:hypothetical protein
MQESKSKTSAPVSSAPSDDLGAIPVARPAAGGTQRVRAGRGG